MLKIALKLHGYSCSCVTDVRYPNRKRTSLGVSGGRAELGLLMLKLLLLLLHSGGLGIADLPDVLIHGRQKILTG